MKILFLTRRFYPHIGGVEKHILKISTQLIKNGHNVTIIAENHNPHEVKSGLQEYDSMPVVYINVGANTWFKKWRIWAAMLRHIRLIRQADIIHAHDVFFWYMPFRIFFFWKKVFTTFHGDEKVFPPRKKAIFVRRLSEWLSRGTIDVGSYLSKWYGTNPDVTIWGAIEGQTGHSERLGNGGLSAAERADTFKAPLKLLFLGRLDADISIHLYVDLLKDMQAHNISFNLTICGDGPLKNLLAPYGKIVGFVKNVDPYIQKADIVLCSSYLAILESLRYKKRVIALSDNPMKKDYLYMTPWKSYLSTELPKGPFSAKQVEELNQLCQELTWENTALKYEQLWKK